MIDHALVTQGIISAAIEVHRNLGPGLLESVYEECLCRELSEKGVGYDRQVEMPICYKGNMLNCGYRIDLIVEHEVVVELKAVSQLERVHEAQLLTYLRLTGKKVGLLLNFNVVLMKNGIKRLVNGL
ncbi:MAG: GxxExxY protein [Gammaproteobacteria bacterium]